MKTFQQCDSLILLLRNRNRTKRKQNQLKELNVAAAGRETGNDLPPNCSDQSNIRSGGEKRNQKVDIPEAFLSLRNTWSPEALGELRPEARQAWPLVSRILSE